ncbi:hypothetical protein ACIP1U_23895 [Cupriavidus sp. NPDC089707]|uniref:hypothetical protein n=1 Tax=Cupriavidus sp. NPDC089707 TaxID=3363963 RepID=UPI0038156F42
MVGDRLDLDAQMGCDPARQRRQQHAPQRPLVCGGAYDITPALTLAAQIYTLRYRHSDNKAMLYAVRGSFSTCRAFRQLKSSRMVRSASDCNRYGVSPAR